nr:uncharacterized protein LOC117855878 [Setaria viridis]
MAEVPKVRNLAYKREGDAQAFPHFQRRLSHCRHHLQERRLKPPPAPPFRCRPPKIAEYPRRSLTASPSPRTSSVSRNSRKALRTVNNAVIVGIAIDVERLKGIQEQNPEEDLRTFVDGYLGSLQQNYELAKECLDVNFNGRKDVTTCLIPLA